MIEQLSREELNMMNSYRSYYAPSDQANYIKNDWAPMEKILAPWESAKNDHLYQMFGNKFILSKRIEYIKDKSDIITQIQNLKLGKDFNGIRKQHSGEEFVNAFLDLVRTLGKGKLGWEYGAREYISDLELAGNAYTIKQVDFPLPDGKMVKADVGTKPLRVLAKIAKAYDLPGFEEFRIGHSLILNQNKISGCLSLSIHPMDYMTMSDNDCGWDSCMQWTGEGGYRQGTVEMMNSPTVVVAYLNSTDPYYVGVNQYWNNKRWRQLFVVDRNCVVAVKGYPYQNNDLTQAAMDWILELAKENLGWKYAEPRFADLRDEDGVCFESLIGSEIAPDGCVKLQLDCGRMYDDLGSLEKHLIAPSLKITEDDLSCCTQTLILTYSGVSECMACGETNNDFDDESCLLCDKCMKFVRCEYCGDRIGPDSGYSIDGRLICDYCYENNVYTCHSCGEEHVAENMRVIQVLPRLSKEYMKNAVQQWRNKTHFTKGNYIPSEPENVEFNFNWYSEPYWVCDCHDCISSWKATHLKENANIYTAGICWDKRNYVYLDDLVEEELKDCTFSFRDKEDGETVEEFNQAYIEWLEQLGQLLYPLESLGQL